MNATPIDLHTGERSDWPDRFAPIGAPPGHAFTNTPARALEAAFANLDSTCEIL